MIRAAISRSRGVRFQAGMSTPVRSAAGAVWTVMAYPPSTGSAGLR